MVLGSKKKRTREKPSKETSIFRSSSVISPSRVPTRIMERAMVQELMDFKVIIIKVGGVTS
jgi:phosphoribosylcarboxyaminoimidazole (NCAIR) mutase